MKLKQRKQGKGEHHEDRDADDQSAGETGDEDKANVNKTVPDKANNARAFPDKESPIPAKRERSEKTDASVLAEREDDKRATGANVDVDEQPAPHMRKNISASVQLSSFDAGAPMSAKEAALVTGSAEVVPSSMATARPKVVRNIRIIEDGEF